MDRYVSLIGRGLQHPNPGLAILLVLLAVVGTLVAMIHAGAVLAVRLVRVSSGRG